MVLPRDIVIEICRRVLVGIVWVSKCPVIMSVQRCGSLLADRGRRADVLELAQIPRDIFFHDRVVYLFL